MGVRAGADAEPIAVAPVPEVVERTLSGPCPVRDLVVAVAGVTKGALRHPVHAGDTGVIGLRRGRRATPALQDRPAATRPIRDGAVGVEPQLERVAGEVVGAESRRNVEVALPARNRLAGPAKDEIEVDVEARGLGDANRADAVVRLVGPPERPQAGRVEALRAERKARQTEREPGLESRAVQGRGVRLKRHLARTKHERGAQRIAEARDLLGLEQARGAAAEEEGAHTGTAKELALPC